MSLNSISYSLPSNIEDAVRDEAARWNDEDKISRIWSGDASVWTGADEAKWLGWLDIVDTELNDTEKYSNRH